MSVRFSSDGSIDGTGFRLKYWSEPPVEEEEGDDGDDSGGEEVPSVPGLSLGGAWLQPPVTSAPYASIYTALLRQALQSASLARTSRRGSE